MEIGRRDFYEKSGKPYCEQDYRRLFAPKCARCDQAIVDVKTPLSSADSLIGSVSGDDHGVEPQLASGTFSLRVVPTTRRRRRLSRKGWVRLLSVRGNEGEKAKPISPNLRPSRECYMDNFVPKCLGCKEIIVDTYIQALGGHYHKDCFVCKVMIDHCCSTAVVSSHSVGMCSTFSDGFVLRTRSSTAV